MMKKVFFPLLLVASFLSCADALAAKRVALVIGNAAYRSSPLRNPVNDATDVAAALKGLGFDVIRKTDVGKREMVEAIRDFGQRSHGAEAALFFYAGHGMQVGGRNYLIPVGAGIQNESEVEFEAVDANRILARMEDSGAGVNIVILDACRENPFRGFRAASRGLAVIQAVTGSFVAYSTAPGSVAADGKGRNSPFARHLLQHMAVPGCSINQVFMAVRQGVSAETGGRQVPWDSSSLMGDFYFTGPPPGGMLPQQPVQVAMAPSTEPPSGGRVGDAWTDPVTGMEFVWVPGGCFQMENYDKAMLEVCVDGFWMGKYEVTNAQYRRYRPDHDSGDYKGYSLNGDSQPVVNVNWEDAAAYAQWLSGNGNGTFCLPSGAEWEYAARAGTATARYWGDDPDEACRYANVHDQTSGDAHIGMVWAAHNCEDGYVVSSPVGHFHPNAYGLYDMLGNAWEWVQDWSDKAFYARYGYVRDNTVNRGYYRGYRGGSWCDQPDLVSCAVRARNGVQPYQLGFRLVREP